jgi:hypothetical protein
MKASSDYSCIPVCTDCHTMRPDSLLAGTLFLQGV